MSSWGKRQRDNQSYKKTPYRGEQKINFKVYSKKEEVDEYNAMTPSAKRVYLIFRSHGFSHEEAVEELSNMALWGELEGTESPLGSGTREEEDIIVKNILGRRP